MELTAREWAEPAVPTFRARLTAAVQDGVLIGVKWMIVSILSLWGIGWVLQDYAAIREQARYVATVRAANAQTQASPPARSAPVPAPAPPTP